MIERSFLLKCALLFTAIGLGITYLLLNPPLIDLIIVKPLYIYSFLLFLLSFLFVSIIVSKSTFLSPSLFLLIFFIAVPVLGQMNSRQYFANIPSYFGRSMPSFDFPTFLYSVGTVSFFGGVMLGWFLLPKWRRDALFLWDHKRIVLLLSLSLIMATFGTMLAFFKIGYIPLLKFDIKDETVQFFNIVGPLVNRFSQHWPVPALLASMLFFLEKSKKKYMYLLITIFCAIGAMFYGQRTGFVWIISAFALMLFKFFQPRLLRFLAICCIAVFFIYGLMVVAEHRGGQYATDGESRIVRHRVLRMDSTRLS